MRKLELFSIGPVVVMLAYPGARYMRVLGLATYASGCLTGLLRQDRHKVHLVASKRGLPFLQQLYVTASMLSHGCEP